MRYAVSTVAILNDEKKLREEFSQQASWVRKKGENPEASEHREKIKTAITRRDTDGLFIVMCSFPQKLRAATENY